MSEWNFVTRRMVQMVTSYDTESCAAQQRTCSTVFLTQPAKFLQEKSAAFCVVTRCPILMTQIVWCIQRFFYYNLNTVSSS